MDGVDQVAQGAGHGTVAVVEPAELRVGLEERQQVDPDLPRSVCAAQLATLVFFPRLQAGRRTQGPR